ncbi:MAG: hypothetical protein M1817_001351 [Caeruleum heppii]|nr:MAG: hypothetical protein M1817_001351 [Caeruleum heppii]
MTFLVPKPPKKKAKPKQPPTAVYQHQTQHQPMFHQQIYINTAPPYSRPPPSHSPHSYPANPGWASYSTPYLPNPQAYTASQPQLPTSPPPFSSKVWNEGSQWKSSTQLPMAITAPVQTLKQTITGHGRHDSGVGLYDQITSSLDSMINLIDEELYPTDEKALVVAEHSPKTSRGGPKTAARRPSRDTSCPITNALTNTSYFTKVHLYANSRLSPNLPPLKLHLPIYPLICLAAQHSRNVYNPPNTSSASRSLHIPADWRMGTKAMTLTSVPLDKLSTVIFAIRGSQTFMDWAVNLNASPQSPAGFLDDPGNLVHSGFLSVARKMLGPVAARLRALLEEDPSRAGCELLITGHSAGGAVAALLYSHMLSHVSSSLNHLTGCFKRIHCITFGAPPVSLLPLQKPHSHRLRKSLFLSFINEGDPVTRADKAYVRSLVDLYASPPPGAQGCPITSAIIPKPLKATSTRPWLKLSKPSKPSKQSSSRPFKPPSAHLPSPPLWPIPPATLSNAGTLILLRTSQAVPTSKPLSITTPKTQRQELHIHALVTSDQQLRGVVFGEPRMHEMSRYERRVEVLATEAVLGRGKG